MLGYGRTRGHMATRGRSGPCDLMLDGGLRTRSRLLPSWLWYTSASELPCILNKRCSSGGGYMWLSLDRVADRKLGSLVYDDGVIKVVVLEAIIIIVVPWLRELCQLRQGRLLDLRELDRVILQLLQCRVVQIVETVIRKVVHISMRPGDLSWALADDVAAAKALQLPVQVDRCRRNSIYANATTGCTAS